MREDDVIARALGAGGPLEPTPGFTHRVMSEVHRVAEEPAPIPFPWHLFAIGLVGLGTALVLMVLAVGSGVVDAGAVRGWSWRLDPSSEAGGLVIAAAALVGALAISRWVLRSDPGPSGF